VLLTIRATLDSRDHSQRMSSAVILDLKEATKNLEPFLRKAGGSRLFGLPFDTPVPITPGKLLYEPRIYSHTRSQPVMGTEYLDLCCFALATYRVKVVKRRRLTNHDGPKRLEKR
jgi:hypothetical protein